MNTCYFNSSDTNYTELVKNHHFKEVKENKRISEERRNAANAVTGKGILKKSSAYSFLFTKLWDDLALSSKFLFLVSNMDSPYLDWSIYKEHFLDLVWSPVACTM